MPMVSKKWYNEAKPLLDYIVCPIGITIAAIATVEISSACCFLRIAVVFRPTFSKKYCLFPKVLWIQK